MSEKIKLSLLKFILPLLVMLFLYTGLTKIFEFQNFRLQLNKSPFLTEMSSVLTYALPITEVIVSIMLLFSSVRLLGLYTSLFLLTIFTTYLFAMVKFSYYVPCSCGGVISSLSWNQHILFNMAFMLLTVIAICVDAHSRNKTFKI